MILLFTRNYRSLIGSFEVAVRLKVDTDERYYRIGSYNKKQGDDKIIWTFSRGDVRRRPVLEAGPSFFQAKIILYFQREDLSSESGPVALNERVWNIQPNLEKLSEDFGGLLNDQTYADTKLKCGDQTFTAHRCVLAARSQVFAAMFCSDMEERRTGIVDITDMDADVVSNLLQYLYRGRLSVPDVIVPGLYTAADKYAVNDLKESCRERLLCSLEESNCFSLLRLADAHSDDIFKKAVIKFIRGRRSVILSDAMTTFAEQFPELASDVRRNYVPN